VLSGLGFYLGFGGQWLWLSGVEGAIVATTCMQQLSRVRCVVCGAPLSCLTVGLADAGVQEQQHNQVVTSPQTHAPVPDREGGPVCQLCSCPCNSEGIQDTDVCVWCA
jgi:hypothetical protein